jgi:hypothetical protein
LFLQHQFPVHLCRNRHGILPFPFSFSFPSFSWESQIGCLVSESFHHPWGYLNLKYSNDPK